LTNLSFRGQSITEPFKTITAARDAHGLVVPYLRKYHGLQANESRCSDMAWPIPTIDTSNRFALVTAFLSKYYTGVIGADVRQPMPTVTAIDHNALVAAHRYGNAIVPQVAAEFIKAFMED